MKTRKVDRRIQRTRQLLRDALMDMIVEINTKDGKSYDAITIQDITDRANVARTTFYLHYKDKDELLFEGMREIYDELFSTVDWHIDDPNAFLNSMADATDFIHVAEHADFYKVMLSEKGSASLLMRVRQYLADNMCRDVLNRLIDTYDWKPNVNIEMLSYVMAGSLIGAIKWWLDNDMVISPQEIAQQLERYTLLGLPWAIGMMGE